MIDRIYHRCAKCLKLLFVSNKTSGPGSFWRPADPEDKYPEGHGYLITYPKYCPDCTGGKPEKWEA